MIYFIVDEKKKKEKIRWKMKKNYLYEIVSADSAAISHVQFSTIYCRSKILEVKSNSRKNFRR